MSTGTKTVDATIGLHELKQLPGSTQDVTTIILVRHGQSQYNVRVLIKDKDGVERKVMLVQGASLDVPLQSWVSSDRSFGKTQRKN